MMKLYLQGDSGAVKRMEEFEKEWNKEQQKHLEALRQTCLTGVDIYGNHLPVYYINQLKQDYKSITGRSVDDEEK